MKEKRVLIVDDDEDFCTVMKMSLEGQGIVIETANSGEEAIRLFREKDFDVAFLDVMLPGLNGVESFMEIRKIRPKARIVMMTGYSVEQLLDKAVENGAWAVLQKPLDMKKALKIIEEAGSHCILIADDDPDFIEIISDILTKAGKKVSLASNGQEAVERVAGGGIDILILDLKMPVLDGLGAFLEMKRIGHVVPTIIVTGYAKGSQSSLRTLESMAVSGILRKPFDPQDLLDAVEHLCR